MRMTDFELRANNIITAIEAANSRIENFGYSDDPPAESVSRIYGMFVTWLTACEESRLGGSYSQSVIAALPSNDDPLWPTFIQPQPTSTLQQRASALWGIRIAFTHGDGDVSLITNAANKAYATNAPSHFPGVTIAGSRLSLTPAIAHSAIRTIVQVRSILP